MGIKSSLVEFVVRHDLIPARIKWRKSASGVGRLFNDMFRMMDVEGRKKLSVILYNWGLSDANEAIEMLDIGRDMHGCAIALLAANHIFGVKGRIVRENEDELVIHVKRCLWKDKEGWTPEVCASIERYDIGLINGIDGNVKYSCPKRRSKGDKVCEIILKPH